MLPKKQIKKNNQETFVRLGRQFYERRLAYGITLDKLAMKTQTSPHYLEDVESGKAYLDWGMLSFLAAIYDCKIRMELEFCAEGVDENLEKWRRLKVKREAIS